MSREGKPELDISARDSKITSQNCSSRSYNAANP